MKSIQIEYLKIKASLAFLNFYKLFLIFNHSFVSSFPNFKNYFCSPNNNRSVLKPVLNFSSFRFFTIRTLLLTHQTCD